MRSEPLIVQNWGILFTVPVGESTFKGAIRINDTSAFIVDCLKNDTTPKAIVDKMYEIYDAPAPSSLRT